MKKLCILLCCLITVTVSAPPTCSYFNQQTDEVEITTNVQLLKSSNGDGSTSITYEVNENESFTISCKNPDTLDFQYGTVTVYTCPTGGSNDLVNLPVCVALCTKAKDLSDDNTSFLSADEHGVDIDVSTQSLQANTIITIKCKDTYAQKYGVSDRQVCEEWTAEETCQKMCPLSAYDTSTTRLEGTGVIAGHLRIGYPLQIKCIDSSYALPIDAPSQLKCESAGQQLDISNCEAMCTVPVEPASTTYHKTQDKLPVGQTFTVTCKDNLKLPFNTSDTAECKGVGGFTDIPKCTETCKVTAAPPNTLLDKQVNGLLAQGEAVKISCKEVKEKLPYPYVTPYPLLCQPGDDFQIPVCQGTCTIPADPPKALVQRPTEDFLRILEPLSVKCKEFYSYQDGGSVKTFDCDDSTTVDISEECYLDAKLKHAGAGTKKVELNAEIDDTIDLSGVSVKIIPTVPGETHSPLNTKPNTPVTIEVLKYGVLSVKVETTSEGKTITREVNNVYPGPPSPKLTQVSSTSTSVQITLTQPADIDPDNLVHYTIEYDGKTRTTNKASLTLTDLSPSETIAVSTKTELVDAFGGVGTAESFNVYTGAQSLPVDTISHSVKENSVTISWNAIGTANNYMIEFNSNTYNQVATSLTVGGLETDTEYDLSIGACRKVGKTCWYGDKTQTKITTGPSAPSLSEFTVTNTSDSVNISRVVPEDNNTGKRSVNDPYVVFVNNEPHELAAGENTVQIFLALSTKNEIAIAKEAAAGQGYGGKTPLGTIITADCRYIKLYNFKDDDVFNYALAEQNLTATCAKDYYIKDRGVDKSELQLMCNDKKQYVYADAQQVIFSGTTIACQQTEAVIVTKNNTKWYIIGGVALLVIIICILLIVAIHSRRNSGSYDAKKFKENTKNGAPSPDAPENPPVIKDSVYFNNGFDNDKLCGRGQSCRSKATSYGSQELRMEIADSDSGITEDLDHTIFNPNLFSTMYEEDAISTKSALV